MATEVDIDDSLYSRQRYVLGDGAMQRMAKSSVLLYGVGGLGIEIAKNIVLAGIKSLTVQDPIAASTLDLGTQFFLRQQDVQDKKNRAVASVARLCELNPYVTIKTLTSALDDSTDLQYLKQFNCIILTEVPLSVQLKVDTFCRANDIKFISADVYGMFCGAFCDFGEQFEVFDTNGEDPKDAFVADITKDNPGVVTIADERMHGFETDDTVTFKEVTGMTLLNDRQCQIKVINPYKFSICDTTGAEFLPYQGRGIVSQVKTTKILTFESLETQLRKPEILFTDFSKFEVPGSTHAGFIALNKYREMHGELPNAWNDDDCGKLIKLLTDLKTQGLFEEVGEISEDIVRLLSYTCRGSFVPLCATLGGVVAQEALKAITGKFTPLKQWLYLDAIDVINKEDGQNRDLFQARGDRYDQLRFCIGEHSLQKLQKLKLFMVGCGAIGCEMIKNYALMGIGSDGEGKITITDNDLIEKSNLNRQFLFRSQHIRHPKSTTAAQAVLQINPSLNIEPQQQKVCLQTEKSHYPDSFFEAQDLIVNALDNVEARRYVDGRCVTAQRSLLESGTMGTKGHTQIIVAHLTESYGSQNDPPEQSTPYCTLKSFPANIEHCIQWARDKFESSFAQKPNMFNKFWTTHADTSAVLKALSQSENIDGAYQTSKVFKTAPCDWAQCITLGRLKFEKYFNHKAKHLLTAFPMDTKLSDGSLFWQSPRRAPIPLVFDPDNPLHMDFVLATAHMFANTNKISMPSNIDTDTVKQTLAAVKVPPFVPTNKKIEVEESKTSSAEEPEIDGDDLQQAADTIQTVLNARNLTQVTLRMLSADFEKDDDSNGHIDFITAAANLRASMYAIETADRLKIKRIAGKIVPAIATTTAAVAGLISIELVKVVEGLAVDKYRNCFLNLALPIFLLSEPGPASHSIIKEGLTFTNWDRWEVRGNASFTLQNLIDQLQEKVGSNVSFIGHGQKLIYMAIMPQHRKRLTDKMTKLLKAVADRKYEDLVVSFISIDDEDIDGPAVRYFF